MRSRRTRALHDAAVEQHRASALPMRADERRQVARDRRVGGVGQAELVQADAPRALAAACRRARRRGRSRRRARARPRARCSSVRMRAADDLAAAAEHRRPAPCRGRRVDEQRLLGGAARVRQRRATASCRACAPRPRAARARCARAPGPCCRRRGGCDRRRRRARARGCRSASLTAMSEKSVVPPPTSHTRTTSPTASCWRQRVARCAEPRVERGLRLLEQRHVRQAGVVRRAHRQLARDRVERRRHREQHVLLGERRVGMRVVPRRANVREVARRRLDAATPWRPRPAPPRQDRRSRDRRPRGTATTSPTTPAASAPASRGCAPTRRRHRASLAPHGSASCSGGTRRRAGRYRNDGSVGRASTVPGGDELRDGEHLDRGDSPLGGVDEGERRVGGAEIDADDESRVAHAQLDLGRRDHASGSVAARRRRQRHLRDAPAVVAQRARERRLADDVADEPDARRIEPGIDAHLRVLRLAQAPARAACARPAPSCSRGGCRAPPRRSARRRRRRCPPAGSRAAALRAAGSRAAAPRRRCRRRWRP